MLHVDALELVQQAGGQVTFVVQRFAWITNEKNITYHSHFFVVCLLFRGPSTLASLIQNQRPISAMPWSLANATSYLDKNFSPPWSPSAVPPSPMVNYI
jgi:hypothetical protein